MLYLYLLGKELVRNLSKAWDVVLARRHTAVKVRRNHKERGLHMAAGKNKEPVFFLGGYDAKSCPEKTRKTYDPAYADVELDPIPVGDVGRMEAGNVFEDEMERKIAEALEGKAYLVPACTRSKRSKKNREKLTLEVAHNPGNYTVIWNARLPQQKETHRTGEPDLLVLYGFTADGKPMWLPVDVKDHSVLSGSSSSKYPVSQFETPQYQDAVETDLGKGSGRKEDLLQLAHYQRMLEHEGLDARGTSIGGVIGREGGIVWFDLHKPVLRHNVLGPVSALAYYDYEFAFRVEIARSALSGVAEVGPEWKAECNSCIFRSTCHMELKNDLDHITLVPGITPNRAVVHYERDVEQIGALARLDHRTAVLVDANVDVAGMISWAHQVGPSALVTEWKPLKAKAAVEALKVTGVKTAKDALSLDYETARYSLSGVWDLPGRIDQARVMKTGKVFKARGIDAVSIPRSAFEQDFDVEDYDGFVYMIGIRTSGRKKRGEDIRTRAECRTFVTWEQTAQEEARVFAEAWEHLQSQMAYAKHNRYGYKAYHYGHHERSTFKTLAARHAGLPNVPTVQEVEDFFNLSDVIDLHKVISEELVWPTESLSLKDAAKWARFSWRDSDPSGDNSRAWYLAAISDPDESVRNENRERLIEYNVDDVHAQEHIRDWLTRLGEARQPGTRLKEVSSLEGWFRRRTPPGKPSLRAQKAANRRANLVAVQTQEESKINA